VAAAEVGEDVDLGDELVGEAGGLGRGDVRREVRGALAQEAAGGAEEGGALEKVRCRARWW